MRMLAPLRRTIFFGGRLSLRDRYQWLKTFHEWQKKAFAEDLPSTREPDMVAIVLSFRRPYNIDPIVRVLLKTPSIAKVIVSNNNPAYRMSDWISVRDPRISIIEQVTAKPAHVRYGIAAREKTYSKFLAVDDDLFVKPSQLEKVCESLRTDPSRPYGIAGQIYDSWRGMLYHNINDRTQKVDILNRIYAFTSEHVENFFAIAREAGYRPDTEQWKFSHWDDLFLSFSGKMPQVIFTGTYLDCPSQAEDGVAVWRTSGFFRLRLPILLMLRKMRPQLS